MFRRISHPVVDSTNERAFAALARGEARHLDAHVAEGQTAGRGRRGRSWVSEPGEGLFLSVILLPPRVLGAPALTVGAGLALFDALGALGVDGIRLDWPNDLEGAGGKLAGILVETRGLEPRRPHYVVGIGVNVRQRTFPPELLAERRVTSLALEGHDVQNDELEEALLDALVPRLRQVERQDPALERDYVRATGLEDARIEVELPDRRISGRLVGFGFQRGLEVEIDVDPDGATAAPPHDTAPPGERTIAIPLEHVRGVRRAAAGD